jgi:hypothetical protein
VWFLARADRERAFRRQRPGGTLWRGVHIHYSAPRELKRMLAPYFTQIRCAPLGFALPPSYASGWLERRPQWLAALTHVERAAQRWQALATLADHYIVEARRLPAADA